MHSEVEEPLNIGSSQMVTINELIDMVEAIAGVRLHRKYILNAPKGVRGRNSDNTLIQQKLSWEPSTRLEEGMERTFAWIYEQMTGQPWQQTTLSTPLTPTFASLLPA
jgi:nucleoside-diphosphate-sugar epimerase